MGSEEEDFESAKNLNTGEYIDDEVEDIMDIAQEEDQDHKRKKK